MLDFQEAISKIPKNNFDILTIKVDQYGWYFLFGDKNKPRPISGVYIYVDNAGKVSNIPSSLLAQRKTIDVTKTYIE